MNTQAPTSSGKTLFKYFLLLIVTMLILNGGTLASESAGSMPLSTTPQQTIQAFEPLSNQAGWLLDQSSLWFTANNGQTWNNITPSFIQSNEQISSVDFLDEQIAYLVSQTTGANGEANLNLWHSTNSGTEWQLIPLDIFAQEDIDAYLTHTQLFMLDTDHGWLATKRGTSRNFSVGALFYTADGGHTWAKRTLPSGNPIYFVDHLTGWTTGGPLQDTLYHTADGGQTWSLQTIPPLANEALQRLYLPVLNKDGAGQLHALSIYEGLSRVVRFSTVDNGRTWIRTHQTDLSIDVGDNLPLAQLDAEQWLLIEPQTNLILSDKIQRANLITSPEGMDQLAMLASHDGWGKQISVTCDDVSCQQVTQLWSTNNQGQSWQPLNIPQNYHQTFPAFHQPAPADPQAPEQHWSIMSGQGLDKCEVPTISQLQTWMSSSPYRAVNLYIGGSSRACANSALSASYLQQLSQQGWKFIPTWVGPQAACSGYGSRMSGDPATAYAQGKAQADLAISVSTSLGLASSGNPTVIYYDLEGYPNDANCRNAAKSFIAGWTYQLKLNGHQSGVYGSACASYVSDWASASSVPDAIWPAAWYANYYDANATIWGLPCVDNGLWVNNQRIRQYAGGHNETWGGVSLNIDSNILSSRVADISNGAITHDIIIEDPTQLQPPYNNGCWGSGWERYTNNRGHYAYLTLNTNDPAQSTNWAEWRVTLPVTGQWRVYAYIPTHPPIAWPCLGNQMIWGDTILGGADFVASQKSGARSRNEQVF